MNLLFAQAATAPDESVLMIIGVSACLVSLALLLWKKDAKSVA